MDRLGILAFAFLSASAGLSAAAPDDTKPVGGARAALIRSAKGGPWSSADTWEGGKVPAAGDRVQVRTGHSVTYDMKSDEAICSVHVAGTLTFARDRDTALTVGLIKIQAGDDASEDGFNCDAHPRPSDPAQPRPALEVGTPDHPIPAGRTAVVRLAMVEGLDKESCPAIISCGGRLDLHGVPLARTWVKLGATAEVGTAQVRLAEPAAGWRVGDRVIVTATGRGRINDRGTLRLGAVSAPLQPGGAIVVVNKPGDGKAPVKPVGEKPKPVKPVAEGPDAARKPTAQTEERVIIAIDGDRLTLDRPLEFRHVGEGDYRGEVANLSRNVVVESADPKGDRGHTMYHRHSAGSIGYAEFRHLGKEGVLGKYPVHFHLCGDTMRGSSVVGASVWDSQNRWVTVHGTQYLVVRDCVGYQSVGHGFFLEDGTEVFNVFDRNLGVQAFAGKPLPQQSLPADRNDGAGFWWANNLNTFIRNVAAECDRWGFLFDITPTEGADLRRPVLQPDGTTEPVDIRTLPFVRFEENEAHDHLDGISLGRLLGGFGEVVPGGDPLLLRNIRIWNAQWAFTPFTRYAVDGLDIADCAYGLFRPAYDVEIRTGLQDGKGDDPDWGRISFRRTVVPILMPTSGPSYFGAPFDLMEFAGDCLPPTTVITHARRADGTLVVRGTAADNDGVRRVLVNGREARPLAANFAEWEVMLDPPADGRLTARAVDLVGNEEPGPHTVVLGDGGQQQPIVTRPEPAKPEGPTAATLPGGDAGGLDGLWRVESQRRAGRPAERPRGMTWEFAEGTIVISPGGKANAGGEGQNADPRRRGGIRIPCRLDPDGDAGQIELNRKVSVNLGIYKREGDILTLCIGSSQASPLYDAVKKPDGKTPDAKPRPTEFSPEAGTLIVLKRVAG